jgi:hypothetical protein
MTHDRPPSTLTDELRSLTASELSLPARLRYVGLLLAASTMTTIVSALWLTEPTLPRRTSIALVVLAAIGVSWMTFAAWVLSRTRMLLGRHRVVAGRLAVSFSTMFVAGALVIGAATGKASGFAAAGLGVLMLAIAVAMLIRAERAYRHLSTRREMLEHQLRGSER